MFSDATESYYGNQVKSKIHQKNSYENEKKIWKKIEKKSEQILRKQNCCIFFSFFFPKNYFLCCINGIKISPDSAQRGYK